MSEETTKNGVPMWKGNWDQCRQVDPLPSHSKLSSGDLPAHPPPRPPAAPSTFPDALRLRKELPDGCFRYFTRRMQFPRWFVKSARRSGRIAPPPTMPPPSRSDRTAPPPAMLPPSIANRLAAYWVVDALASDESLDFSVLRVLVDSLGTLEGAPETTRERVALRCLQQLSSVIPAGGDAAATARVHRFDATRSCQDVLFQLTTEVQVRSSGKLDKDLLPPFSSYIREAICSAKLTLPETCICQLKEDLERMEPDVAEAEGRPLKRVKGT